MKDVNLVLLLLSIIFFLSLVIILGGGLFLRKDGKKRTRWATNSSLFFSVIFFVSLGSIILTGLISITKDFGIFYAFLIFGIAYLYLFLKGRSKYKEKFE